MVALAWLTGKMSVSAMLTWGGREAAQTISSAMSSATTERGTSRRMRVRLTRLLTGLETFIYLLCCTCISTVPHNGELCLDHAYIGESLVSATMRCITRTRLYFRHPNGRVDQLSQQRASKSPDCMFSSGVYTTSCIRFQTGDRTEVNDVAGLFLFEI